jgi:hypothetical protein
MHSSNPIEEKILSRVIFNSPSQDTTALESVLVLTGTHLFLVLCTKRPDFTMRNDCKSWSNQQQFSCTSWSLLWIRQLSVRSSQSFAEPKVSREAVIRYLLRVRVVTSYLDGLCCVNKERSGLINHWLPFMSSTMTRARYKDAPRVAV